jgi:cell division protein FtsL
MRVKGRYLVIGWTAVFLAAVGAIVFRTKSGFEARKNLTNLNTRIQALEGIRGDVRAQIAGFGVRSELAPKAQAMGLRFASDSELRMVGVTVKP